MSGGELLGTGVTSPSSRRSPTLPPTTAVVSAPTARVREPAASSTPVHNAAVNSETVAGAVSSAVEPRHPGVSPASFTFMDPPSWASFSPAPPQAPPSDPVDGQESSGTLLMAGGRSKYLGPNASSEWLRDQESKEADDNPAVSRLPSPARDTEPARGTDSTFPFSVPNTINTEYLLSQLPEMDEGKAFTDSYYRYFAWQYDIVPRAYFEPMFNRIYASRRTADGTIKPAELAVLYIVFAMGAHFSLELPPNDPIATEYLELAQASLVKSNFLVHNTIQCVQTLHVMAHFHLRWDCTEIRGLGTCQRTFWKKDDTYSGKPSPRTRIRCSISSDYVDTKFPKEHSPLAVDGRGFFTLKWEVALLLEQVLNLSMKIRRPPDECVGELHRKLSSDFERTIPFPLRCRSAWLSLPSLYADSELAIQDTPDVRRRDLHRTFQCTLAVNVSEAFLFLHRPNFVKALREQRDDMTKSIYAQSFFSVIERCNVRRWLRELTNTNQVMVVVAATLHSLFPSLACRHWFFWHHAFNSAVMMGTLIIRNPKNTMAPLALTLIDSTILLLSRLIVSWPSTRLAKNLKWLNRLRGRATAKLASVTSNTGMPGDDQTANALPEDEEVDVELVGWCTRLVERASSGSQVVRTILSKSAPSPNVLSLPPDTDLASILDSILNTPSATNFSAPSTQAADQSTDALLHEFWDPMLSILPPSVNPDLASDSVSKD
ncbi:uncharacterized protein LOC62_02G001781 [Vanrija pseudolonga]|uniref:Transcription factor domain-containing protein n=1 Tax=Vanrija pseudolonga TaxID=143232 RepID=A0AAF0Y1A2_9TREE|nr:hypothetical protein LOC62_02G001781 [Vanrija pseudolonga]